MAEESQQERTEDATGKRREEFREKGQVAQSKEVNTAALMTASLILWIFYAPNFMEKVQSILSWLIRYAGEAQMTPLTTIDLLWTIAGKMAVILFPIFLLTMIVGFLASYLQVGPLFTVKPFTEIDLNKFNPIKGMARFVSKRSAVELVKSLAKVGLIGFIAYRTVAGEFEGALDLISMPPSGLLLFLGRVAFLVLLKSCGLLILLAILDYGFTRWEMEQKMKMTKQEVKEEFKETEGDPQVKGRIRSLQMAMARNRMMAEVPQADVVITNPTHYAVALSYKRDEMAAPTVVAKGADHLAAKIREIAKENEVPLVENKPVARALYKVELGESIPEDLFKAVAEILAYVYGLKRN